MSRLTTIALALAASALVWNAGPPAVSADGTAVSWDLIAGRSLDVGTVTVDRVGDDLKVLFEADPGWRISQVHVYAGLEAPRKAAPGSFPYGGTLPTPASEWTVLVPLASLGSIEGGTTVYVAAHAVVEPLGEFYVVSGPDHTFVFRFNGLEIDPPQPAAAAWCHPTWETYVLPGFLGTGAQCVWATELVTYPQEGEVVDFRHDFTIGSYVEEARLAMAADNGFVAFLNGAFVGSEGLFGNWRDDHSEDCVQEWDWLHGAVVYDVTSLLRAGANTMLVAAANEESWGADAFTNPAGLVYALRVRGTLQGESQSAWADGLDGALIRDRKSWGTYVAYVVPGGV